MKRVATVEIEGCLQPSVKGANLFRLAEACDVRVPSSCQQQGKCRECLVEVLEGMAALSPRAQAEAHLEGGFRLSCCSEICDDTVAIVARTLRRGGIQIVSEGYVGAERGVLSPAVSRVAGEVRRGDEIFAAFDGPIHGLALDLGTTTVVGRVFDLESGALVSTLSFENPQRFGGSDVMARIHYDTVHGGRLLQRTLNGYLAERLKELPISSESICEVVVAGNSTMRDLFFGLDVSGIGQKPYRSLSEVRYRAGQVATTALEALGKRLHLPIHPQARVYGLPIISGHVGGDAAACLLAIEELISSMQTFALMDIGTNTELIVGHNGRLWAASCPAGPAFEGGAIRFGMAGLPGAIERVQCEADGSVRCFTIGQAPAQGICGSGMISLLSELLRSGRMNPLGRLEDEESVVLDVARAVSFDEGDINELAQAKGANAAGLRIVLARAGLSPDDLDAFYLAGGFGQNLDLEAARRIGMIPDLPLERLHKLGNAALEGATRALLSLPGRHRLEGLVRGGEHVELETDPGFFDHFVEGCQFRRLGEEAWVG